MNALKKFAVVLGSLLYAAPAMACPILAGTTNQGPLPGIVIPEHPNASYVPPGYITAITVNGTHNFTITHTRTSDGLQTTTPATTGNPAVTLSGIADNGWSGARITSLSYSGNTIRINGANEITVSGANPLGATQNWNGNSVSGVQEIVFNGNGGSTLRGFDLRSGQPVVADAGFNLSGSCASTIAGTLSGNSLSLTATPSAGATSVQFFVDGASVSTDNSSPFAFTANNLSVGTHTYHALTTFPAGTLTSSTQSVTIQSIISALTAGKNNACVVMANGTVKCWGAGLWGQIGNGSYNVSTNSPTTVSGITSGATKVSSGDPNVCAVVSGGVKCWGANFDGILGPTSLAKSATPVQMIAANSGVIDVGVGTSFACALYSSGAVKCWGRGTAGQMGNGTNTTINTAPVTAVSSGATKIDVGAQHTCAIISGGLKCWGSNFRAQLGDSSTTNRNTPTQVTGLTSGVTAVDAGSFHTCAIHSNVAKCWGYNGVGEIGTGAASNTVFSTAQNVAGLSGTPSSLSVSDQVSCAINTAGRLYCWGDNSAAQMGQGNTSVNQLTPITPTGHTSGNTIVAAGYNNVCSFISNRVKCWGDNSFGQIGDPAAANPQMTSYQVLGL